MSAIANCSPKFIELAETWLQGNYGFPRGLKICCLAQWIEESGWGNSSAFQELNNAAGLFWRVELEGVGYKVNRKLPSENIAKPFTGFNSLDAFCRGYVAFINRSHYRGWERYANNPKGYLKHLQGYRENGKVAPYCARRGYVQRVLKLTGAAQEIASYVQDEESFQEAKFIANSNHTFIIDAGHGLPRDGGAVGVLNEQNENQAVALELRKILQQAGHKVVMARPQTATSTNDSLRRRVATANRTPGAELFISIHFNAFNKKAGGIECWVSKNASVKSRNYAKDIQANLVSALKLADRGVKKGNLYVVNRTICPAVLVEVCFCDSARDANRYKQVTAKGVAVAIARGVGVRLEADSSSRRTASMQSLKTQTSQSYPGEFEILNMIKYWEGLPHQIAAVSELQSLLNSNIEHKEIIKKLWRNEREIY